MQQFVNFTFEQFFYDSKYIKSFFQPLLKISDKNFNTFIGNQFENNMIFMFVKNINNEDNFYYKQLKSKIKQFSLDKKFASNEKIMFIQVNDEYAAEKLGMSQKKDGDMFLVKK